jgi:fucose permease
LRTTWLGLATFFFYSGLELAIGLWLFTLLNESRHVSPGLAAAAVTTFWAGIVLARMSAAAWATEAATHQILRRSLLTLLASTVLLAMNAFVVTDLAAVLLAGIAAGPVFPLLMAATRGRIPPDHVANVISLQIAAATIGQALLPSILGTIARRFGLHTLGLGLVALAVLATGLYIALERARPTPAS